MLPPLLPCCQPVQPHTKCDYESPYENLEGGIDNIVEYESYVAKLGLNDHIGGVTSNFSPCTLEPQHDNSELSFEEAIDEWFKTKTKKYKRIQQKKDQGSAKISTQNQSAFLKNLETQINQLTKECHTKGANEVLNLLIGECEAIFTNESVQIDETSSNETNELQGVSFVADDDIREEDGIGEDRIMFDMYGNTHHSKFKQYTQLCDNENVDTLGSSDTLQEPEVKHRDVARTCDDPYSRRFEKDEKTFDNEVRQLANEYDLRIGKKGYVLDDMWKKCEQIHGGTMYSWYDEGFEEEEQ
nr:BYPASS-related protein [Tanacetum cinerariifolium]